MPEHGPIRIGGPSSAASMADSNRWVQSSTAGSLRKLLTSDGFAPQFMPFVDSFERRSGQHGPTGHGAGSPPVWSAS